MLSLFDIVGICLIGVSAISGFSQGAVRFMIGVIGVILAIPMTFALFPSAMELFGEHVQNHVLSKVFAISTSYVVSMAVCSFVSKRVKMMVRSFCGNILDKLLGFAIGGMQGLLIFSFVFFVIALISASDYAKSNNLLELIDSVQQDNYPKWLKNSRSLPVVQDTKSAILDISIIRDFASGIALPTIEQAIESTNPNVNQIESNLESILNQPTDEK